MSSNIELVRGRERRYYSYGNTSIPGTVESIPGTGEGERGEGRELWREGGREGGKEGEEGEEGGGEREKMFRMRESDGLWLEIDGSKGR